MKSIPEELPPLKILLKQLDWNLEWLRQMEKNEATDYFRDAALQRFEFTFTATLKCIRAGARISNATCESPEECLQLAERMDWLPADAPWQELLQDYENMKSGTGLNNADTLFARLKNYREIFQTLFERLSALELKS